VNLGAEKAFAFFHCKPADIHGLAKRITGLAARIAEYLVSVTNSDRGTPLLFGNGRTEGPLARCGVSGELSRSAAIKVELNVNSNIIGFPEKTL
jgi:hypothetical protein